MYFLSISQSATFKTLLLHKVPFDIQVIDKITTCLYSFNKSFPIR